MTHLDIRVIAAVGRSGQIGLNNKLPWKNAEDTAFFKNQIRGGIVIVGRKTREFMPPLFDCHVDVWSREGGRVHRDVEHYIGAIEDQYKYWPLPPTIWIAGGEEIYRLWAPFVKRLVISTVNYDGPTDSYFPWDAYQANIPYVSKSFPYTRTPNVET